MMSAMDLWKRHQQFRCEIPALGLTLDVSRMRFDDAFLSRMEPAMESAFSAMDALERGAIANPDERRMVIGSERRIWRASRKSPLKSAKLWRISSPSPLGCTQVRSVLRPRRGSPGCWWLASAVRRWARCLWPMRWAINWSIVVPSRISAPVVLRGLTAHMKAEATQ